jgi:dolichyl-phosphate beta-glucosyltransferase
VLKINVKLPSQGKQREFVKNMPTVSYIIPTYQAESVIYNSLKLLSDYCNNSKVRSEIIIVNDGSTDRTHEIIEAYLKENGIGSHLMYINLKKNVGKGAAIKRGIEVAKGQYIVFTDCDLPYSFNNIDNVVTQLINNKANVVVANRMHEDSLVLMTARNKHFANIRSAAGRFYSMLVNLLFNLDLDDTQAGLKGFDRDTAELIFNKMTISRFSFDVDILVCAKEHGKIIASIPIDCRHETGMNTITFVKQVFEMTFDLLRIFMKYIFGIYRK